MIRLIASDMDGTLLNEKGLIAPETAQAIRDATAAGIEFMIATGRSIGGAQRFLLEHDLHPAFITLNGGRVFDEEGTVVVDQPMSPTMVKTTYDLLNESGLYYEIVTSTGVYTNSLEKRLENMAKSLKVLNPDLTAEQALQNAKARVGEMPINFIEDYSEFLASPETTVMKFIAFSQDAQEPLDQLRKKLESHPELVVTASARTNVEINNAAAQKGLALKAYAEAKGFTMDEVMALGDNLNDHSMIAMSGYGTAMGNAVDEIKKIAHWVTETNVNHGVAKAIYRAIELNESEMSSEEAAQ